MSVPEYVAAKQWEIGVRKRYRVAGMLAGSWTTRVTNLRALRGTATSRWLAIRPSAASTPTPALKSLTMLFYTYAALGRKCAFGAMKSRRRTDTGRAVFLSRTRTHTHTHTHTHLASVTEALAGSESRVGAGAGPAKTVSVTVYTASNERPNGIVH